ncbi:uroporphyrinogen decarboxylase family protein [Natranaerofaba carboxydovora]|uniref:uroporphyrinogen decarboxylase family protein n=1 Tax=Natranaerofaba carboxydovora TaxID=2742683 RepID=UPI001F12B22F|nr:uroporphyrinogen decarboxylase family protein [Natranaerofaba carboxydovora]UMZ74766.1 Uroporphyrinogen decarboxylase (URO-D) [Natranaerofaba carboxydovora]
MNDYEKRLARYQATCRLETPDRLPIGATGSNYYAEIYAGYSKQETIYESDKLIDAQVKFCEDFPEVDVLRAGGRVWGPLLDSVGANFYKLPGKELSPNTQFQYIEEERMKADEYDFFMDNPVEFFMDRILPRTLDDYDRSGSTRSYITFLKGGMAFMDKLKLNAQIAQTLENKCGMPQPFKGGFLAPFDFLADGLRGLNGIMMDLFRRPDKVKEACDWLVPQTVRTALMGADPERKFPIFVPLHRGNTPFLSPKQFENFYWPSLKKTLQILIDAGYQVRCYLEGDWSYNWHHFRELPKGSVICDIDNQGDIFKAYKDLGGHQCIAGGVHDNIFILSSPEEVKEKVKTLCEKIGQDGGLLITGGCAFPYDTKPENFKAYIDTMKAYATIDENKKLEVKSPAPPSKDIKSILADYGYTNLDKTVITPWEVKKEEIGDILGDEEPIKNAWEKYETIAYHWLWSWTW